MANFYSPSELHDYIKKLSTTAANKEVDDPESMYWRAVYSFHYRHYVKAYSRVFTVPSPIDLTHYRHTVGETVMCILSRPIKLTSDAS